MADELLLSIEKLIYGGDGLAHTEDSTVFVPFVLPGEQVMASVRTRKKKQVHANLVESKAAFQREDQANLPSLWALRWVPTINRSISRNKLV